jgi:ubiquinone/menaquinone biosynthesis C-methylase UbiE
MTTTLQFEAGSVAENYHRYLEPVLFAPWAERLVSHAGVRRGDVVVDLASGTGAVARAAAHAAGREGRVIATDVSARMLAYAPRGARPGSAPIETQVHSALELDLPDASADVVLCQQGLQFMDDYVAVLRECRRVLRPGGVIAVAVWAAGEPLDPFDAFADALSSEERTFSNAPVTMSVLAIVDALCLAGFGDVTTGTHTLTVRWPTLDSEVAALFGTPFGPVVERMDAGRRDELKSTLRGMLGGAGNSTRDHLTTSVFGRGTRPVDN